MRTPAFVKMVVGSYALACGCGRAVPAATLVAACATGARLACGACGATFQAPALAWSDAWLHVVEPCGFSAPSVAAAVARLQAHTLAAASCTGCDGGVAAAGLCLDCLQA